ncbi:hypothetical protein [Scytonema hofmannii]|uniref:hypothetical protein n=1 Tax=Scytonema hofmannii TaxID=34078 RepID=UPI0003494B37|nr:hypothetical protein [Scytonema hofmannii]
MEIPDLVSIASLTSRLIKSDREAQAVPSLSRFSTESANDAPLLSGSQGIIWPRVCEILVKLRFLSFDRVAQITNGTA